MQHPDAWRSLPEDDLLHASAHRAQLRGKRVVRFDSRWMRCHWPGLKNLCRDVGRDLTAHVACDASAASGIGARRGVGKIRHLDTRTLWLQKNITEKEILLRLQKASENPSDLGTTHLDQATMSKHVAALGFEKRDGKFELSLRATL